MKNLIASLDLDRPVLIAGPTASGKSALAMEIATKTGGAIVNADALQVFADWRVLTARPSEEDEAALPHRLYGHVPGGDVYSVGRWLREATPLLEGPPPVIVGGTGLNFSALTEGLAEIPQIPFHVRSEASARMAQGGIEIMLRDIDGKTAARIDRQNPARVRRAWEVQRATGRGLADWQDDTPPPKLPLSAAVALVLEAPKAWLTPRIERRFDMMLEGGALEEARANAPDWHEELPSAKAIGARELIDHVNGHMTLEAARDAAIVQTRQYAKRQRTWFRARMNDWRWITPEDVSA